MSRFQCVDGHKGSVHSLTLSPGADVTIGATVSDACPRCGKDVKIVPCNKHASRTTFVTQNAGVAFRRPFAVEAIAR